MSATFTATMLATLAFGPSSAEAWRPPELLVRERVPVKVFEELREIALQYVGRPYEMGGVGSPAFDCSGFTCRVFAEAGYAIPRVSRDQAHAGRAVPLDQLAPGDLLFFSESPSARISHVGMYLGEREILHASSGDGEVTVANLDAKWFRDRLRGARRILASSTATIAPPARTIELVEHDADDQLLPMLRRPVRAIRPSYGPELFGQARSAIGVRTGALTEQGELGWIIAPEATLYLRSIALEVALALPIRFQLHESVSVGEVHSAKDLTRYVRTIALGLRGADLQVRMSQLGDLTLGNGLVVDKLTPASEASGVPGFSIARAPLSLFAGVRTELASVQAVLDDVADPELAGISVRSGAQGIYASAGFATDQSARAINAIEAELSAEPVETRSWSLDFSAGGAALRALGTTGVLGIARASAQYRFGSSGASYVSFGARGGYLGRGTLDAVFSATYLANRSDHDLVLAAASPRPFVGGEAHLRIGRFLIGALYEDALGTHRLGYDRRLEAVLSAEGLPLWGTTLLDLRVGYASRGAWRPGPTEHALHANLGIRVVSWLSVEAYAENGATLEGGGAVSLRFEP